MFHKKKMNYTLAVRLGMLILITTFIIPGFAQFGGGSGTEEDPWQIATAEHLDSVRNYLDGHFEQTTDISLDVQPWNVGAGWQPIGINSDNSFTGVYDGFNYTINYLFINRPNERNQALFGYIEGALIKNLGVINVNVTGGTMENGSLVGKSRYSEIRNCFATGNVNGFFNTGGLIGDMSNSTLRQSFSIVNVAANNQVGGLVGTCNSSSTVSNSYSKGNVSGGSVSIGGLIGELAGSSSLVNSYSTGRVEANDGYGGLIGTLWEASVSNSYWDINTSNLEESAGGTGKTTAEMIYPYEQGVFVGWDFDSIWVDDVDRSMNGGYPYFFYYDESIVLEFLLTIEVMGEGLTSPAEGSHRYSQGEEVVVEATDIPNWSFEHWIIIEGGEQRQEELRSVTLTIDGDMTAIAYFSYLPVGVAAPEVTIEIIGHDGNDQVLIAWEDVPGAGSYNVFSSEYLHVDLFFWELIASVGSDVNEVIDYTDGNRQQFYYVTAIQDEEQVIFIQGGDLYSEHIDSFYLSKFLVSQRQYTTIMGHNPSFFQDRPENPVENITWFEAIEYCNRLSMREVLTPHYRYIDNETDYGSNPENWPEGWNADDDNHTNIVGDSESNGYRLPTLSEFEFAARGGVPAQEGNPPTFDDQWPGTNHQAALELYAWYVTNSNLTTHPVGTKAPNELGLFDMAGNVWEWNSTVAFDRWLRQCGGSWNNDANSCAVHNSGAADATSRSNLRGFRVARNSD